MAREDFNDLLWFLALAEDRSFTKAAAKLGITQSTLSHTIKRLETRLGLRLLTRTTRSVSLTEAGERLFNALLPRITAIRGELEALSDLRDKPAGTVRITLSDHALETVVWPKLQPILKDYPDIKVELSRDNGLRNIVEDGFDAGVRLGESIEKDMIAVRIGPDWRMLVVASPAYLADKPLPQHPQDLVAHNCINMRQATGGGLYAWEFEKDGQELRVRVAGQLTFNTSYPMVDAAVKGLGVPTSRTIWLLLNFQQARSSPSLRTGRHPFRLLPLLPEPPPERTRLPGDRRCLATKIAAICKMKR